jgi:hypothetical protein
MSSFTTFTFPAPVRGWLRSGTQLGAPADAAEVLDNFFVTASGAELRKGKVKYATLGASVVRLITYRSATESLFASTAAGIFNISVVVDPLAAPVPAVTGTSSGDWSSVQMSSAGGEFLVAVNGTDYAQYFNGTAWHPIAAAEVFALTYDALTAAFAPGETVTGGTSGATAAIIGIAPTASAAGVLKVGAITGTFQDNEAITSAAGAAVANIPSGTASASAVAITNVDTRDLTQVWSFKERLFFAEKGTQSAWYLPTESIGGAASELDLGSVFRRGGTISFGGAWSLDAGDGIDDVCVFVSSGGEIAVYEGNNPGSAATWALAGVYDIGEPLDKHANFRAGGDLAILTEDGIVSVAGALRKDRAALQGDATTFPIQDEWQVAVQRRAGSFPISATLWQSGAMLLVGVPAAAGGTPQAFIANARTGAWSRFTGWDVRCGTVSNDRLYFGSDDGAVYRAYSGGTDDGVQYSGVYIPKAQGGNDGLLKIASRIAVSARSGRAFELTARAFGDYAVGEITAPAPLGAGDGTRWGSIVWGAFVWGGGTARQVKTVWKAVGARGYALAPGFSVTSSQTSDPVFEIVSTQILFEIGSPL